MHRLAVLDKQLAHSRAAWLEQDAHARAARAEALAKERQRLAQERASRATPRAPEHLQFLRDPVAMPSALVCRNVRCRPVHPCGLECSWGTVPATDLAGSTFELEYKVLHASVWNKTPKGICGCFFALRGLLGGCTYQVRVRHVTGKWSVPTLCTTFSDGAGAGARLLTELMN